MSESDKKPNVQAESAPTKPAPAAPPVQPAPAADLPLTGSSKAEKAVEYLNRLRTSGKFDPNLPLSNESAREYAAAISKLAKEEISVSTVKDARGRLLKLAVQAVNPPTAPRPGEAVSSHPQPKQPPAVQQPLGSAPPAEGQKTKAPLTPEEKASNKRFIDRFVTWTLEKAESQAPPEDKDFIISTYADALDDSNSKVPSLVKIGLATAMLVYYIAKSAGKIRTKIAEMRKPKTPPAAKPAEEKKP